MYTIDLLNGQGIPIRSRPWGIAFWCIVIGVPVILGIGIIVHILDNRVALSIQRKQLERLEASIDPLSEKLRKREALEANQTQMRILIEDIRTELLTHTQWSPVLSALVENLSDALVLTHLEGNLEQERRLMPAPDDPLKQIEREVYVPGLKIGVSGIHGSVSYEVVRELQNKLRYSERVGSRLDQITISQQSQNLQGQEVVSYELNCQLHPLLR